MNEAALLDALRAAMQKQPGGDGITIRELRTTLGLAEGRARELVRGLIDTGVAEHVPVQRAAMNGRIQIIPGYRLVKKRRAG